MKSFRFLLLILGLFTAAGCTPIGPTISEVPNRDAESIRAESAGVEPDQTIAVPTQLDSEHLPNLIRIHQRVLSGGLPQGDAAFEELAQLGIKTVISVDGMTPDVETAGRYGLRYVHMPHGYDGIPDMRVKELAKAVSELEGPIYIHCHHGKHRSPAAASVACVSAGLISADQAMPILRLAGTDPKYQGLYDSVREATAFETKLLGELRVQYKEKQSIPPMAEAMVHLSHANDRLTLVAESQWRTPESHPDLSPLHETLLLRELFTELLRTEEVRSKPDDFKAWLEDSEAAAKAMEMELHNWNANGAAGTPPGKLLKLENRIIANCKACHAKYRDIPLSEK